MIKLIATWNNQRLDLESPTSTTAEQVHQLVSRLLNTTLRHCGENMFFTWAILEGMAATLARFGWEDSEGMEIEMNSRDSLQTSLKTVRRRISLAFTWRWVTAYLTTDQQLRSRPQWSVFIIITSLQHPSVYTRTRPDGHSHQQTGEGQHRSTWKADEVGEKGGLWFSNLEHLWQLGWCRSLTGNSCSKPMF